MLLKLMSFSVAKMLLSSLNMLKYVFLTKKLYNGWQVQHDMARITFRLKLSQEFK